jgi:hypothetical protein
MMSTGNGSSMNPKPVPAWLNSAAWASKPSSPVRASYSFSDRSSSATVIESIGKPAGDFDDPLSSIAKLQKETVASQEENDATGSAAQVTQGQVCSHALMKIEFLLIFMNPSRFASVLSCSSAPLI